MLLTVLGAATQAQAACVTPSPASPEAVSRFGTAPDSILSGNPAGGAGLIAQVRDLALSDVATVRPLLGLANSANPGQAAAIGTGLAQAASMCVRSDGDAARAIMAAIVQANNERVMTAFRAVAGDLQTLAVGGGGGGGGGGGLGGSGVQLGSTSSSSGGGTGVGTTSLYGPNSGFSFNPGSGSAVTLGNTSRLSRSTSQF